MQVQQVQYANGALELTPRQAEIQLLIQPPSYPPINNMIL